MRKEKKVAINKWLTTYNRGLTYLFTFGEVAKVLKYRTVEEINEDKNFIIKAHVPTDDEQFAFQGWCT